MPSEADENAMGFEQLKLLFDYTKFHITAYLTLASAMIALTTSAFGQRLKPQPCFVWAAIGFIVVAGAAGGVVASNIPYFANVRKFVETEIGPWGLTPMSGAAWMTLEHIAFWLSLLSLLMAFWLQGP